MLVVNNTKYIDDLVDVILKRTLKELRCLPNRGERTLNTLKGAVKLCHDSRIRHSFRENYYENISYWPDDMGLNNNTCFGILFMARVITNVMPIDKHHAINSESFRLLNRFNECLRGMLLRVLDLGDASNEMWFLIKYGEELGYALMACHDVGDKLMSYFGKKYTPIAEKMFFNEFYPKHIDLPSNTFLI
jgi:hypothetical protein